MLKTTDIISLSFYLKAIEGRNLKISLVKWNTSLVALLSAVLHPVLNTMSAFYKKEEDGW